MSKKTNKLTKMATDPNAILKLTRVNGKVAYADYIRMVWVFHEMLEALSAGKADAIEQRVVSDGNWKLAVDDTLRWLVHNLKTAKTHLNPDDGTPIMVNDVWMPESVSDEFGLEHYEHVAPRDYLIERLSAGITG